MGQKIAKKMLKSPNDKKSPKWQKMPIGPRRHVAKLSEAGRSLVTSKLIFLLICVLLRSIEEISQAAPNAHKWFQLYIYKEKEVRII